MLEFHPLHYKKKPCVKNHLIFLFCNFIIDFLFVSEVLYESICYTKGPAQPHSDHSRNTTTILFCDIPAIAPYIEYIKIGAENFYFYLLIM